ncbi:unnamed protein product, partial [Ixodes pacificus]
SFFFPDTTSLLRLTPLFHLPLSLSSIPCPMFFCLCASVAAQLMSGFALLRCSGDGSGGWQFTIHMYKFQKKKKKEKEKRSPHHSGGGGNMDDHAHVCAKRKKKE